MTALSFMCKPLSPSTQSRMAKEANLPPHKRKGMYQNRLNCFVYSK